MKAEITHINPAHEDARGKIVDVFDGENIRHIGHITSAKGTLRGNHYHKIATQWTYILKGKAEWLTKNTQDPDAKVESQILGPGDLAIDSPYVAHAIIALEDTEFVFFTDVPRTDNGYEQDTFRVELRAKS